jgi:WG containing repeat
MLIRSLLSEKLLCLVQGEHRKMDMVYKEKYGYIGTDGNWIVEPHLLSAGYEFSEGLASIVLYPELGFVDNKGRQIITISPGGEIGGYYVNTAGDIVVRPKICHSGKYSGGEIEGVGIFSEGLALACVNHSDQKPKSAWGYIDRTGEIVIEPRFSEISDGFSEGLARASLLNGNNKDGYIDRSGNFVIPGKFDTAKQFHQGVAVIGMVVGSGEVDDDGDEYNITRYGYINKTGNLIAAPQFRRCYSAQENRCIVETDDYYGCLDTEGNWVVKPKYWCMEDFSEGLAMTALSENEWGFIDLTGDIVIPFEFEAVTPFREGLAAFQKGEKWGFIDRTGKVVIKPQFDYLNSQPTGTFRSKFYSINDSIDRIGFSNGLSLVVQDEKCFFINTTGRVAIPEKFDYAQRFQCGRTLVINGVDGPESIGFMDTSGSVSYFPMKYEGRPLFFDYGANNILSEGFVRVWTIQEDYEAWELLYGDKS